MAEKRQQDRRRAIVAAGQKTFLRNGYGHTSMSAIAEAVGGSKTTLWSHFRNKRDLFAAVVDDLVERYGEALRTPLPADGALDEVLRTIGCSVMATILKPQILAMHRMVMGEAGRFPELGQMLYERGMSRGHARIAGWLEQQMAAGRLRPADPMQAARHFVGLFQSGPYQRRLLGVGAAPTPDEIAAEVDSAVAVFLRAYQAG